MREIYIRNYTDGMMLRASLNLLWWHVSWPLHAEKALTMTEWGPFCLTANNTPYIPIFIRTADRALHHATNAWRNLVTDISNIHPTPLALEADARIMTNDYATKYEIEAFLGAVVAITDKNLIGIEAQHRLGKSLALGQTLINQLGIAADEFRKLGTESKWRAIRDNAYHLKPGMTDWGFPAQIRKQGKCHIVELQGIHYIEGASADFVELFAGSFNAFVEYIIRIRDLLTQFSFQHIFIPQNNRYQSIPDPLGNMIVGFGRDGYTFQHFPNTALDFVGPLPVR